MSINKLLLPVIFLYLLSISCDKNDNNDPLPPEIDPPMVVDPHTQRVNNFIHQGMTSVYLWNEQLPQIDWQYENNSQEYFEKLLVKEDKYSRITDNINELLDGLSGIEKTFGYSLTFFWEDNDKQQYINAVVEYVYPNSPASRAGIIRGDLILAIDGQRITPKNMNGLIENPTVKIELSKFKDGQYTTPQTISLTSAVISQNPVHTSKILNVGDKKTGYLFYTSYIQNFNYSLDSLFTAFKTAGVSELILDLRYNLGGDNHAIINLCSHIAPATTVQSKELIITNEYNKIQEKIFKEEGIDRNYYFTDTLLNSNLDLKRVFILTSRQTYSASEVTIVGLQPYMEVICIGETTGGKYTGMSLVQPLIKVNGIIMLDPAISNWALFPIVSQNKNKNGHNSKGGIVPAYNVNNSYLPMVELGDETEPLIAKAIELIGGKPSVSAKEKWSLPTPQPFASRSSRYDEIKKNLIMR